MKKHTYLNKSKKLLLAAMTIPLAVSVLPMTENVYANQAPTLNVYELNGNPKLEWASEMLNENILAFTSFENGELRPSLGSMDFKFNSLHEYSSLASYSGNYGYLLNDNSNGKGNHINYPATESDRHLTDFGYFYFENGIPLSLSFKAKSIGDSHISPIGDGGWSNTIYDLNSKFTRTHNIGENVLYLDNVNNLNPGDYITLDKNKDNVDSMILILTVDKVNNTITLGSPITRTIESNENLKTRQWRMGFGFNSRSLSNTDWQTININTVVTNFDDYNVLNRGVRFFLSSATNGQLMIDDLRFGYATEVEVYRDGQSVYKGFLSDFHDTTARNNVKPNKVTSVNSSFTNDFNIHFNFSKPESKMNINYQIQSIAKNGTRSQLSSPKEIEIKTDVVKYKYSINNSSTGTPSIETMSLNDLSIPLKSINLATDYLHIQAIDENGNESDVSSFKLNELIDMQDLYDKVKELENSNDYNDFIDFIDEIESLYGDNLPQDLKEMIDKLGQHHGVNTSFLLLEQGDFRLSTSDIESFGSTKLTAKKQTLTTAFKGDFGVIDARGTQDGWHVSVSATPFEVETFDGFIGSPHQLPVGSLELNSVNHVEQVGTVHNSQLPDITLNQYTAIDGQNSTINLLNAEKQKGMGEFKFSFAPDALALTVDAVTAKIDTVNYPDQNTPYASTVTWDLVSGPQM